MSLFFFSVRIDGKTERDPEGSDLPDLSAAREQAIKSAREIVGNAVKSINSDPPDCIIVADSKGRELLIIPLIEVFPHQPLRE